MKSIRGVKSLPNNATYDKMDSPVGELTIISSTEGLHAILWDVDGETPACKKVVHERRHSAQQRTIIQTKKQLKEYFSGKRKVFDLPLVINGTHFQTQTWQQLLKIPYGQTITYGEQAKRMGNKNKARAVGVANGCNPISIVIPCHRVIGSNGKLVGFAGGIEKKSFLLELESTINQST